MVKQEKQTINQKELNNESGRSMVEMLGVLALMGVLAIGGVMGYRWAMDRYNANEIINEVKKRAFIASQQRIRNLDIDLHEFHPNIGVDLIQNRHLVSVTNEYNGNSGFFTISVDHVPEGICNALLDMDWTLPIETKVGEVVVTDDTRCPLETESLLTFAFENTLKSRKDIVQNACDIDCPIGTNCINNKCICSDGLTLCGNTCCSKNQICSTSGEYGVCITATGECTRNEDCKKEDGSLDTNKYCSLYGGHTGEEQCYQNFTGECRGKEKLPEAKWVVGLGNTYYGGLKTWWGARNWCLSHGKKLLDISGNKFNCGYDALKNHTSTYCQKPEISTQQVTKNDGNLNNRSDVMLSLIQVYEINADGSWDQKGIFWTDTTNNSCQTFMVRADLGGKIEPHFFSAAGNYYASVLCVD